MEYRNLRGTGLKVSKVCLGAMTFGEQTDQAEAQRMVDAAIDAGVNFFDTSDRYTGGKSEEVLGNTLVGKRDKVVVATKVCNPIDKWPNNSGLGRKHIMDEVEVSLRKLKTDYIDLYYLHHPDPDTPIEDTIETMTNLVRSGKIRYYGLSNFSSWQFCSFIHTAREMGGVAPVASESVYNMITRGIEDEMVAFLYEYKIGLAVYNPIAAGLLTGKHSLNAPAADSRFALKPNYGGYYTNNNFEAIERLKAIAEANGMTLLEMSLSWLAGQDVVDSVILGASKIHHLEQNMGILAEARKLSPEVLGQIDDVWASLKGSFRSYHEVSNAAAHRPTV